MRKFVAVLLIALMLLSGINVAAADKEYDPNINYMDQMLQAAARGDMEALEEAARLRNLKIAGEKMTYEPVSPQELINTFENYVGYSLTVDYMDQMYQCALAGDMAGGRNAAQKRNIKIAYLGLNYLQYSFDDFILLSKVISTEAGDDRASLEWKMCVGEVVLNRVANSYFPNSISEVVYQEGQYASPSTYYRVYPTAACYKAAIALLNGQRVFNDINVVFQANFVQGHGIVRIFTLSPYSPTYFCYY